MEDWRLALAGSRDCRSGPKFSALLFEGWLRLSHSLWGNTSMLHASEARGWAHDVGLTNSGARLRESRSCRARILYLGGESSVQ